MRSKIKIRFKYICIILLIIILLTLAALIALCSYKNLIKEDSPTIPSTYIEDAKAIIYTDSEPRTVIVKHNYRDSYSYIEDEFTKEGFYLKGLFDQPEGGKKYFRTNGRAFDIWLGVNGNNILYTQWGNIYDLVYNNTSDYEMVWTLVYGAGADCAGFTLSDEMINAIKGNLHKKLFIKFNFEAGASHDKFKSTLWISDSSSEIKGEKFGKQEVLLNSDYSDYEISIIEEAATFKDGKIFLWGDYNSAGAGYAKNISLTVMFIDENTKDNTTDVVVI